jgi:hypothetical protein
MSANRTPNVHTHRIRHRRRLDTAHPNFAARHPKLTNFLSLFSVRFNAFGSSITAALNGGGTGYAAGDVGTVSGGTFTRQATYRVLTESAGVVTAVQIVDYGEYTVNPGVAAATAAVPAGGTGLTVDTTLSTNPSGITDQELLDSLSQPAQDVRARHLREANSAQDVADKGIALA